jgi:lipoate-protein ligase A
LEGLTETVFCLWQNRPSVIVGLNQNPYAEVDVKYLEANNITLARRVTGGGAVYHDLGNLNYSIAGPLTEMEDKFSLMAHTLQQLGVPAVLSGRNDILVDGRKCSGYAKRLSKNRMMIHGTLMWNVDLETLTRALAVPGSKLEAKGIASVRSRVANLKDYLPQFQSLAQFQQALQELLADGSLEVQLTPEQRAGIDQVANRKFRTWEWNWGHSPQARFVSSKKFPCGTVQVDYTLKNGVFEHLTFRGDFMGNKPAEELAEKLIGQRPEAVLSVSTEDYFDSLTATDLYTLFFNV